MNDMDQKSLFSLYDIPAAFALLTRIPMPFDYGKLSARGAHAVWAYPIVGAVVGAIAGLLISLLAATPIPSAATAMLGLCVLVMLTGAMHEDGLADCADGFWGGATKERRLEIMRDSRIGAFGVIALIVVLVAEWSLIEGVVFADPVALFAAIGAASRAPICAAMYALPNARATGLSVLTGRPKLSTALLGLGLGGVIVLVIFGVSLLSFYLMLGAGFGALIVYLLAYQKLGGQTGDVLGASQKLAAVFALAAAYLA
ncbi:MAG: adenosylcobinamide-GDP ribazoletransferase [Pseudomonadota bacterium]